MGFITPDEIAKKAKNAYPKFLRLWIAGAEADFFPFRVRANLKLDPNDPAAAKAAVDVLLKKSKSHRGWGYCVRRSQSRTRDFGKNLIPDSVWIDTLDDLLRLAETKEQFETTNEFAIRVRQKHPQLDDWLKSNIKTVHHHNESLTGLLAVTDFFLRNQWPDCYARQIPVDVDTKFVTRNGRILKQWLDILLPDTAIDPSETRFERRFGLRDCQTHRGIRFLDPALMREVGQSHVEMSLPIRALSEFPVASATVFVVENRLNLLTLPDFPRGIGIEGAGNAVNRLGGIVWLADNRLIYWGDNDVDGFLILSRLRNIFPHVESIMMDVATIESHRDWCVESNSNPANAPTNLTESELHAFQLCGSKNLRLEQEKILQQYVDAKVVQLC